MFGQRLKITIVVSMAVILNISGAAEASSHDVAWTFGNVGSISYNLGTFSPAVAGLSAIISSQIDNFEDGTLQGWSSNAGNDNIPSGGPAGADDNYLVIYRPTDSQPYPFHIGTKNTTTWTGDYISAGIEAIAMDVNTISITSGPENLSLRIVLFGPGGAFSSKEPVTVISDGGWQHVEFGLTNSDLVRISGSGSGYINPGSGVDDLTATLSEVDTLLIRHDPATNPTPVGQHPQHIMATLGIDNIASVSSSEPTYDVALTFGNVGNFSYRLDAFSPDEVELGASIGQENPTLTVRLGGRYQVTVTNYTVHPFQVLSKGPSVNADVPLLTMGPTTSSFESDPDVAWEDDGAGTVTFTLTLGLYNAMVESGRVPGYRCLLHTVTMRGDFNVLGLSLADPIPETIDKGDINIELETVASGLTAPVGLKPASDGSGRLFVADQSGVIYTILNGQLQPTPFLDLSSRVVNPLGIIGSFDENDYDERGQFGIAMHPDFAVPDSPGYQKIYTYTSEPVAGAADFTTDPPIANFNHQSVIAEWQVNVRNPDVINPASRREIIRIDEPQFNHNGGMLAFGPDGYLYISLGDGGAANDNAEGHGTTGNGQNINTVHGSILRIEPVDPTLTPDSTNPVSTNGKYRIPADNPFVGTDGVDEIYAYGFRNPFIFSFDSATGRLIVADVGQDHVEEIDIVVKGGDYGWNLKEGTFRFDPDTGSVSDDVSGLPENLINPVAQYDHDEGISAIGGFIYRGSAIPELFGKYVFGDFSSGFSAPSGRLFYADLDTGLIRELVIGVDDRALDLYIKGFGQDLDGEIYLLASSNLGPYGTGGKVLKIVDLCLYRIPGDVNNDCVVDDLDLDILMEHWMENAVRTPEN